MPISSFFEVIEELPTRFSRNVRAGLSFVGVLACDWQWYRRFAGGYWELWQLSEPNFKVWLQLPKSPVHPWCPPYGEECLDREDFGPVFLAFELVDPDFFGRSSVKDRLVVSTERSTATLLHR